MDYLILTLATWRITSLLHAEDGPYIIFERLRRYLGIYYDEYSQRQASTEIGKAVNCPACLSVWVGTLTALAFWKNRKRTIKLCLPLALSAGAILVEKAVSYGES